MSPRAHAIGIASLWAALAIVTMLALFQGDWSGYTIPLALWGLAVFLPALRWQSVPWLRGSRKAVADRVARTVGLSCLGLIALCTAAAVGYTRLRGCPIMGDPGASIGLQNDESVPLIIYPHGVDLPSVRRVLAPGQRISWSYLTGCGSSRRDEQVWVTVAGEYAGAWVYCAR